MRSSSSRHWPDGGEWVLQPKWDGFRLLVDVDGRGDVRTWSRHGTVLTAPLRVPPPPFGGGPRAPLFAGEVVPIGERGGQAVQDFAPVPRAVFPGDPPATERM